MQCKKYNHKLDLVNQIQIHQGKHYKEKSHISFTSFEDV